jgi:uncharacterized protein YcbX
MVTIEQLWIYPVKSLTGIPLTSATLLTTGLAGDREWMLVDADGLFLSQRKLPRMATIRTELRDGGLVLSSQGNGEIVIAQPNGETRPVKVWKSICDAFVASEEASEWLKQALATDAELHLVHFDKGRSRPTDPQRFGPYHTYFSDGAPYLSANLASLQALNQHLLMTQTAPVDIQRFRPNLVLSGLPAFAEHTYAYLRSTGGGAQLGLKDHCQRCSVITVDQSTGVASPTQHPFAALAELNSMPGKPKAPVFGVNTVLMDGEGWEIRCGDQWQASVV